MIELHFPNAVRDRCDLFGRDWEIELAVRALTGPARRPVIVLGERLVGKTSLQWIIAGELEREDGRRFVALTVPHAHTLQRYAAEIFATINAAVASPLEEIKVPGMTPGSDAIQAQYLAIYQSLLSMASGTTFVLSIDDFDALLDESPADERKAILAFTRFLIQQSTLPVVFLFTMRRPIQPGEDGSALRLIEQACTIPLYLFDEGVTAAFVSALVEPEIQLDAEARHHLYALSGGHPYFIKLILYHLVEAPGNSPQRTRLSVRQIERALERALASFEAELVLTNLINTHFSPEEQQALRWLAGNDPPVSLRAASSHATALLALVQREYLRQTTSDTVAFRVGFLRRWLQGNPAPMAYVGTISAVPPRTDERELAIDGSRPLALLQGREIHLTRLEHQVLRCLARRAEQLVDKDTLALEAWGGKDGVSDQSIDQVIRRVRRKLGDSASDPIYLYTQPGYGYLLRHATYTPAPGE